MATSIILGEKDGDDKYAWYFLGGEATVA